jgi:hypothetical protein
MLVVKLCALVVCSARWFDAACSHIPLDGRATAADVLTWVMSTQCNAHISTSAAVVLPFSPQSLQKRGCM